MRKISKKKLLVAGVATAVIATGGGVALAYWSTTGSGSGDATTSTGVSNQLSFDQNSLTAMYPGDSSQNLTVTVTNNATENVYVADVKAYLEVTPASESDTCTAGDYLLNGTAAPGSAATAASLTWTPQDLTPTAHDVATGTIHFNNLDSNQDGCKGAAVTIHYLAS